jgi:hypothetical protein
MNKLLTFIVLVLLMGCGNSVEDLREKVISIHDEVMPEMSTIHRLSKDLATAAGDSLRSEAQREKIKTQIQALDQADEAMMTWMAEYKAPSADVPKEEALDLLRQEKVKITSVRDKIINSISEAKSLLKELEQK